MTHGTFSTLVDLIAVLFLVLTVAVVALVVLILDDPYTAVNPLQPPKPATEFITPTLTPSVTPTATATLTPTPTLTFTPSHTPTETPTLPPTMTSTPTETPVPPTATITPTPVVANLAPPAASPTPVVAPASPTVAPLDDGSGNVLDNPTPVPTLSPFPFTATIRYAGYEGDDGCQWLGVVGTVTGLNGEPSTGLVIEITGENYQQKVFTRPLDDWGEAAFAFQVGRSPRSLPFTVLLTDPGGQVLSATIQVETGNTCQTNVAIVEFTQNHAY